MSDSYKIIDTCVELYFSFNHSICIWSFNGHNVDFFNFLKLILVKLS